ncbi:MAG: pilus assembly protein CpaE [Maricaulaceae bacterium]|jgi:pilus assembly protein CpaE
MSDPLRYDEANDPIEPDDYVAVEDDHEPHGGGNGHEGDVAPEELADQPVPRITIEAFCELEETRRLIQSSTEDRRMARAHVATFDNGLSAAIEHYHDNATPNLIVVESGMRGKGLFEQLGELANVCDPETKVIVVGAVNDIGLYRELVKRGVSEYLVPPFTPIQFIRAVSSLYADPSAFYGKTIAFLGAKGGVGSSTIAHNTAWCVAEVLGMDATIVDLDLAFGTAALDFNQDVATGVADALSQPDRVDDVLLDRLLTECGERLSLFAAPATVDRDYEFSPEDYEAVVDALRRTVPMVFLDLPHVWSSWLQPLVLGADEVLITATPDLACLRNAKHLYDLVNAARPNDAAPKIILNQIGLPKRPEIPVKEFSDAIGIEPSLVMPFDGLVFGTAANNGQMIAQMGADNKLAEGFVELASVLTGRPAPVVKRSLVDRMLKRG